MADAPDRLAAALADRYRIERELGEGGMATVYLAEDLKHNRKVAIKVLKPELAAVLGADRFVQEIATTAALQHPNILPLFDSGTADGFLYYVMPYVEGESLRDRLNRETQLPVQEAVDLTSEVADALEYAHEYGVVHRDIKPENILLHAGRPMVADFGIALAVSAAAGGRMTETGLSLGTPHYMSPEQATAEKEITGRSDIYSLASVLYEMLTGDPPHVGSSAQQIIMKIVTEEPAPVAKLRKSVPPNVAAAVAKALEKLPADRFDSAKAFADALGNPGFTHATTTVTPGGDRVPWYRHAPTVSLAVVAIGLGGALVIVTARGKDRTEPAPEVTTFALEADPAVHVDSHTTSPFAVSPDGRTIVFRASTDSTPGQLWVRRLDDAVARPLRGTEGGMNPAISPDGAWVAFVDHGKLIEKVRLSGGDVSTVVDLTTLHVTSAALSWASNSELLFETLGAGGKGIERVAVVGGTPTLAIPIDSAAGETGQRRPFVLRDVGLVVYRSYARGEGTLAVYRLSDGRRARLDIRGIGALGFVDGHLIYSLADGTLMAVPFDPSAMRTTGTPVELSPRVASNGGEGTAVGMSESGTLVYRTAGASSAGHLELTDTTGRTTPVKASVSPIESPRFSPGGRRIAVVVGGTTRPRSVIPSRDLWVVDAATGVSTPVTSDGSVGPFAWLPDGKHVAFIAPGASSTALRSVAVDGSAPPTTLWQGGLDVSMDVLPDGKSVVSVSQIGGGSFGLLRRWIDGSSRVDTLRVSGPEGFFQQDLRVSPDGRWVAFVERSEAWVQSTDGPTHLQVSASATNGAPIVWGPGSRHVYYVGTDGLVDVELETSPTLAVLRRHTLRGVLSGATLYDLSPDGKTFAVVRTPSGANDVLVAKDWLAEARKAWEGARPHE